MDLGNRYKIHAIATQGRKGTHEYVTEYIIEYSDDGEGWKSFHDSGGETEVHILIILLLKEGFSK